MYNKVKEICQEITKMMIEINVFYFNFDINIVVKLQR